MLYVIAQLRSGRATILLRNSFSHAIKVKRLLSMPVGNGPAGDLISEDIKLSSGAECEVDVTNRVLEGKPPDHEWQFRIRPSFEPGEQPVQPAVYRARLQGGVLSEFSSAD